MTLEAGDRLGHYRVLGLLGRGGMADVYSAEDERLGRQVALKAVPPEFARDPERVERFEREVRAAARLTHPGIVTVYEYGRGEGQHFYTMALMPGGDLRARIRAHPDGMPPPEAAALAAAVARALDYAHGRGFVHRDVKPENILFGEDGTPQLTDFGIARAMSDGTGLTKTGMSIGSPHYMSPEQARGKAVDGRSDLYSLGVVFYEMLTGRVPFDAADTFAVAYSHINDPVPALPAGLSDWQPVVGRLLAKSPEDRYGDAGELADALAPAARTSVVSAGRPAAKWPGSRGPAIRAAEASEPGPRVPPTRVIPVRPGTDDGTTPVVTPLPSGPGETFREALGCGGNGPEMVVIPPGSFEMGCASDSDCRDSELPVHTVTIPEAFAVSVYPVAFSEWDDASLWAGGCSYRPEDAGWGRGRRPAIYVSWHDSQEYARWLSRETGAEYRLLSESEWEYAARAGSSTAYSWGDGIGAGMANGVDCGSRWGGQRTAPVGSFAPNAFGLLDMHGNVWEWVEDCWHDSYRGAPSDGSAWVSDSCSRRVLRGGSWLSTPSDLRSACRIGLNTDARCFNSGFRVARRLTP